MAAGSHIEEGRAFRGCRVKAARRLRLFRVRGEALVGGVRVADGVLDRRGEGLDVEQDAPQGVLDRIGSP